ncbi:MAG: membrane protein insertion efficiency factor YidD [Halobacteriovoraceae bacterium]|nr:membrane protein insertion efficiency factor YidD [Halobacteriovoraceae bacterium]MCB9094058.1 membrane protein insertion efficiency factor YidD [Halobacteriovoraceae bacterium]
MKLILIQMIKLYQYALSPYLGNRCRFYPTCSQYAIEAFQTYSFPKALFLTIKRIIRCQPFCEGGVDLLPRPTQARNCCHD